MLSPKTLRLVVLSLTVALLIGLSSGSGQTQSGDATLFLHRGDDLPILGDHQIDDLGGGRLVDPEAQGVDGFSWQRLPL